LSHRFQAGVREFVSGAFTWHIGVSVKASCKLHGGWRTLSSSES
jgi:hypothetical protein